MMDEVLQRLAEYPIVLVTGPHRSGTTFVTAALGYSLDRPYTTETAIRERDGRFTVDAVVRLFESEPAFVFQGASMFNYIERVQLSEVATVFVHRPTDEVLASQRRWHGHAIDRPGEKLALWQGLCAAGRINSPFDLHYHDLKDHPLWRDDRSGWGFRQYTDDGETAEAPAGGLAL